MTQEEFEKKLAAMKAEKEKEKAGIESWQLEIKQKKAEAHKRAAEAHNAYLLLKAEQQVLATRRIEVEHKWKARLEKFKAENQTEERKLYEVSDFTLVKELRKRGWRGKIVNSREDMPQEDKIEVLNAFNGSEANEEETNEKQGPLLHQ